MLTRAAAATTEGTMNDATREELWTIAEDDYPAGGTAAERLRFLAGYAVLAPSVHNIQPWRFRLTGERIELRADRSRALPVRDPDDRELLLSCGAALFHLRLALRRFGHAGEVVLWPDAADPDLFARLGFCPAAEPTAEERTEFAAIPHRRTHRGPLAPRPVPTAVLTELRVLAAEEGAWLHLVESEPERAALVALIEEADRLQAADPALQQELPARVRERAPLAGDAGGASGVPLAADAQVLAVLGTDHDTPRAWLKAGQALARMLLRAQSYGLYASYLNQPVEVPATRVRLPALLAREGHPQLVIRFGYGEPPPPAPRRPLAEIFD
jgi:nitroreductase